MLVSFSGLQSLQGTLVRVDFMSLHEDHWLHSVLPRIIGNNQIHSKEWHNQIMKNHIFTFNQKLYKQLKGKAIGLNPKEEAAHVFLWDARRRFILHFGPK